MESNGNGDSTPKKKKKKGGWVSEESLISQHLGKTKDDMPSKQMEREEATETTPEPTPASKKERKTRKVKASQVTQERKVGRPRKNPDSMSAKDAAFRVLSETTRESMTYQEIAKIAIKKGYHVTTGKTPEDSFKARLHMDVLLNGKKSRFVKVGPGEFALRK